mgnify:CR=1 FL=1
MGVVYQVEHLLMGVRLALKRLDSSWREIRRCIPQAVSWYADGALDAAPVTDACFLAYLHSWQSDRLGVGLFGAAAGVILLTIAETKQDDGTSVAWTPTGILVRGAL